MKIKTTLTRIVEDEVPMNEDGGRTVGQFVDAILHDHAVDGELVGELNLTFSDKERETFKHITRTKASKSKPAL